MRPLLALLALLSLPASAAELAQLSVVRQGGEQVAVATNRSAGPLEVELLADHWQGMDSDPGLPQRRVLAVCGDGGFMMNSQELETARRLGLNLVVLILNDGAYGMIRWKQAVDGFTDYGMTFSNPDFVKYAEAYGCKGHEVTAIEQFIPTLEAAFNEGGVHLVSVPVDYSENQRVLVDELRQAFPGNG